MIAMALILILFNGVSFFRVMYREMLDEKKSLYAGVSQQVLWGAGNVADSIEYSFFDSCKSDGIGNILAFDKSLKVKSTQLSMKLLSFALNSSNHVTDACLVDLADNFYFSTNTSEDQKQKFKSVYHQAVETSNREAVWYNDGEDVYLSRTVYTLAPYIKQGYVIGCVRMEDLLLQSGMETVAMGTVTILDQYGNLLISGGMAQDNPERLSQCYHAARDHAGEWTIVDNETGKYFVYFQQSQGEGWQVLYTVAHQEMMASYFSILRSMVVISVLLLAVAVLLALCFAHGLTHNIYRLMKAIRSGEDALNDVKKLKGNDEIFELAAAFIRLTESIDRLHANRYELLELKYRFIQSKINPHFMSNVLASISSYAMMGDQEHMERLCIQTSQYLKDNISDSQYRFTTIQQEINNVQECIEIFRLTSSLNVTLKVNCSQELRNKQMLSMILQPLVENAYIHATSCRDRREYVIGIEAYLKGDWLMLEVSDNGCGISPEILGQIERMKAEPMTETPPTGFGIGAVIRRLQLQYGEAYCFEVSTLINEGTKITIGFPMDVSK